MTSLVGSFYAESVCNRRRFNSCPLQSSNAANKIMFSRFCHFLHCSSVFSLTNTWNYKILYFCDKKPKFMNNKSFLFLKNSVLLFHEINFFKFNYFFLRWKTKLKTKITRCCCFFADQKIHKHEIIQLEFSLQKNKTIDGLK